MQLPTKVLQLEEKACLSSSFFSFLTEKDLAWTACKGTQIDRASEDVVAESDTSNVLKNKVLKDKRESGSVSKMGTAGAGAVRGTTTGGESLVIFLFPSCFT